MSDHAELHALIVEDSEDDTLLIARELEKGGFVLQHRRVQTHSEMRDALRQQTWDLVITDHSMPGFSSAAAIECVREAGLDAPVIIVSGAIGEDAAVRAMKSGAHDYVMKSNLARLVPAVERELREAESRRARRRAEAMIHHMAFHDALTGLVNRNEFELRLQRAIDNARDTRRDHTLLYIDLDQFKVVNDTCGHIAGDELLKQLPVVLRSAMRESDTLARLGGDEFGVLLMSCDEECALRIADKLLQSIREFRFVWRDRTFTIGASIGLAVISPGGTTREEILSAADLACYAAKERGRSCVHVYRDDDARVARTRGQMDWVSRLVHALEHDKLQVYEQRMLALDPDADPSTVHREFLIRMTDADGNIVLPGSFIPPAERYNLMHALDRWIINAVFATLSRESRVNAPNRTEGLAFINLSGASLTEASLLPYVRERLAEYHLNPSRICFEITETAAIGDLFAAVELIRAVKAEGCWFALDDFGAGLSSFSYLRTLPVDFIKIDGAIVREMQRDAISAAIIEAIAHVAKVAGLRTVAEHVECVSAIERLRAMGIDFAQGYAIETPTPSPWSHVSSFH